MVDKDVVLEKVGQIRNCVRRIHDRTALDPARLDDLDTQEIFVLNLQRAIQSCLDLAAHIVADEGLGLPGDLKENFGLLEKAGIMEKDLSVRLQKMVGFRNIAIHEYSIISVAVLKSILQKDLRDIESFCLTILKHVA